MPAQTLLEPRKSPVQARSAASVEAILEATVQVLQTVGKERLTTTRVAERAGVSVGTLYQYFPNKSSLLQAALRRHFDAVVGAVQDVCREQAGGALEQMGAALADGFLTAKLRHGKGSVALYSVSEDVDGREIALKSKERTHAAICEMLSSASDGPCRQVEMVTVVLQGILSGISRQLLESPYPERDADAFRTELITTVRAYLRSTKAS